MINKIFWNIQKVRDEDIQLFGGILAFYSYKRPCKSKYCELFLRHVLMIFLLQSNVFHLLEV